MLIFNSSGAGAFRWGAILPKIRGGAWVLLQSRLIQGTLQYAA